MNLNALTMCTDMVWAAANDALDLESLDEQQVQVLVEVACLLMARRYQRESLLNSPGDAKQLASVWLGLDKNEVFGTMYLDTQHRVIEMVRHFHGTIDGASVYPRVIVQKALELNCAAVIFAHNHPSGIAEPSQADRYITEKLVASLRLIDVRVLDHLVVGKTIVSMAERGWI